MCFERPVFESISEFYALIIIFLEILENILLDCALSEHEGRAFDPSYPHQ